MTNEGNPYKQFDEIIANLNDISKKAFLRYAFTRIYNLDLKLQLERAEHESMRAMDKVEELKQELNKEKANELSSSKK